MDKGSEAAKEAAELVLADDNFASITAAVREGRTGYANIKKVISWTLPTNAGEASTIVLALLLGLTLPITPVQILWLAIALVVAGQFAITYLPPLQQVFETESIGLRDALLILLLGITLFVIIELEKRLRLHLQQTAGATVAKAAKPDQAGPEWQLPDNRSNRINHAGTLQ